MAKHRHRVFEMYEYRAEAMRALVPKSVDIDETLSATPLPSSFNHLVVSRFGVVTHVQFLGEMDFTDESEERLREDFSRLVDMLDIDSKVLLDFAGVQSFSPACIEVLVVFERRLRNRGSRTVLCSLAPDARESFYQPR